MVDPAAVTMADMAEALNDALEFGVQALTRCAAAKDRIDALEARLAKLEVAQNSRSDG